MPSEAEAVRRWLDDILHHIDLAEDFVSGIDETAFADHLVRLYAVIRCLEITSEASHRLPDTLKARHPSIAWKEMAAAGNVYRHEYEGGGAASGVANSLWLALPPLRAVIESERAALPVP